MTTGAAATPPKIEGSLRRSASARRASAAVRSGAGAGVPGRGAATIRRASAAGAAALLGLGVALATGPQSAQGAVKQYAETTSWSYPAPASATGYAADLDGDYAIFTKASGSSVTVAHYTGPNPGDWEQTEVGAPQGATSFGAGATLKAGRAVVTGTAAGTPTLYIYKLSGANQWALDKTLPLPTPPGTDTIGGFGRILDQDGPWVAAGAPNSRIGGEPNVGSVYLANLDTGAVERITAGAPLTESIFGESVEVGDGYLAVASPQVNGIYGTDFGTNPFRLGRVHTFKVGSPGGSPEVVINYPVNPKTFPSLGASVFPFGISLALAGGLLYAAAPAEVNYTADNIKDPLGGINWDSVKDGTSTQGAVYAFDPATGAQVGNKILPPPHSYNFGVSFDVQGDTLGASAFNDDPATFRKGEIYIYDAKGLFTGTPTASSLLRSQPAPAQLLRPAATPDSALFATRKSSFGGELSISGLRALVGTPELGTQGITYLFGPMLPNGPRRTVALNAPQVTYGQPSQVALTSDAAGGAGGEVSLATGTLGSGPLPLNGHQASWRIPGGALDAGDHLVTASFTPPETTALPVTAEVVHIVLKAPATTAAALDPTLPPKGTKAVIKGTVSGQYGTVPTGQVGFYKSGHLLGSSALDATGGYSFALTLAPGEWAQVEVRFPGDKNHLGSLTQVAVEGPPGPGGSEPPGGGGGTPHAPSELPVSGGWSLLTAGLALALVAGGVGIVNRRRVAGWWSGRRESNPH